MICGISSVESGYAEITTPTITSAEHMDVAPILVASELLQALEGPFWREIRGAGLAYGSHMRLKVEEGLLHFSLFRCNQVGKALAAAKGIVEEFAKEKREMRETDVENAVSSTVFSITAREQTPSDTGSSVLSTVLLQVPPEYNANLLERVREVDRSAVLDVIKRYMRALFEPKRSNVSVCCAPNKVDGTISEFAELGYNLAKYDSLMLAFGLQQKEEREQQRSQGGTQEAEQTQEGDDGKKQVPKEQEEGASQSEGQVQQQGGAAEEVVQAMKEEEGE
jgi:Zn-dependent M16 (insulinase) family peptidase